MRLLLILEIKIDKIIGKHIIKASEEVINGVNDHFLESLANRIRTQTNMNVNEVISNRAIQMMGGKMAQKNLFILMIM